MVVKFGKLALCGVLFNTKKTIIIPGFKVKLGVFATRLFSRKFIRKISYIIQQKKEK